MLVKTFIGSAGNIVFEVLWFVFLVRLEQKYCSYTSCMLGIFSLAIPPSDFEVQRLLVTYPRLLEHVLHKLDSKWQKTKNVIVHKMFDGWCLTSAPVTKTIRLSEWVTPGGTAIVIVIRHLPPSQNTGYDQSQGRRPSTLKCIGPISKGDIEPQARNHPSEIFNYPERDSQ